LLDILGYVLFDKNTKIRFSSGSAHAYVPVNPICPKLEKLTQPQVDPSPYN
tara:strand:+ start:2402 stop:2554 length:153 start_codon:yes stop_codon:yes gene_type:complete